MMKKALALAGAAAILLSVAGPALGFGWWWMGSDDVDINNSAFVMNDVYTKADTGDNSIGGKHVFSGLISTGAAGATSLVGNDINSSLVGCVGCDGDVDIDNHAMVFNKVKTKADSGDNSIGGKCVGGGTIVTGAAGAMSVVDNIVNFSMVGY